MIIKIVFEHDQSNPMRETTSCVYDTGSKGVEIQSFDGYLYNSLKHGLSIAYDGDRLGIRGNVKEPLAKQLIRLKHEDDQEALDKADEYSDELIGISYTNNEGHYITLHANGGSVYIMNEDGKTIDKY